jgi:hypothetical protein
MSTLEQSVKKVKSFDFEKAILKVVKDNDNTAIDLNTDSQLFDKGIDSTGSLLPGPYAPMTIGIKSILGQPTDRITLRDTGDFHDGFFMDASKFPLVIDSSDSKTSELKSEWGEDIFGLTDESQTEFNEQILPDIQDSLKKGIGV